MNVALVVVENSRPGPMTELGGIDVSHVSTPKEKAILLRGKSVDGEEGETAGLNMILIKQADQLARPDARIGLHRTSDLPLLSEYANSYWGLGSGDGQRFCYKFWEVNSHDKIWEFLQVTFTSDPSDRGKSEVVLWERSTGALFELAEASKAKLKNIWQRGHEAWGNRGVVISQMGGLHAELYYGEIFQNGVAAIVPKNPSISWLFGHFAQTRSSHLKLERLIRSYL